MCLVFSFKRSRVPSRGLTEYCKMVYILTKGNIFFKLFSRVHLEVISCLLRQTASTLILNNAAFLGNQGVYSVTTVTDIVLKMTRVESDTIYFSVIFRNVPAKTEEHRGRRR